VPIVTCYPAGAMGVLTRERKRIAPPPPQPEPPPPSRGRAPRSFPGWLIVFGLVVLAIATFPGWLGGLLPSFPNPFASETIDRSQPALLRSIQDLSEYRAATGHFEVIVDIERDTALPAPILGERTLFVAVGTVDATVDFGGLDREAVSVSADRRRAAITLPAPELSQPRLDLGRSYVYDRDRGVLNRIGSAFSGSDDQRALYLAAEGRLSAAAAGASGLVPRARENTRTMLVSLLRSLGFTSVTVRFEPSGL
jgi:hypothetical protein